MPAAEEAYQKVLEVDYSFRDTVDRLNKLQGAICRSSTGRLDCGT